MRDQILEAADSLVQKRGLTAVTFQHIADEVNLRKPSLFHHIANKEELTLQLIDRCETKYGADHLQIINRDISAPEKLKLLAAYFEDALKQERPCLLSAIAAGWDTLSESARSMLANTTLTAIERVEEIFKQGRREGSLNFKGTPNHAAMAFYSMLQGLQTLCRAKNDTRSFMKAAQGYIDSISQ